MVNRIALACLCLLAPLCRAQSNVQVNVDLDHVIGKYAPVYNWFGYDESGYTTTPNGKALLGQLHDLSPVPVYVRAHFLLATGDGKPDLKWSSSNVYTEDAQGNPVYSWTILDQIFDAYAAAHVRPMVELGFMPKALSSQPDPYHIGWPLKPDQAEGWSFPPRDFTKWQALCRQVAAHLAQRYGAATVSTWYWEVWNEPNLPYYWRGTQEQYNRLYDAAVAGVRQAIPGAIVGGPATTGPGPKGNSSQYLRDFLAHCARGKVPLDFISFHVKGQPNVVDGHVQMGIDHELSNAAAGFAIVREFPQFAKLPIILSEADPEGCAACSARTYPPNAYRNGTLYPAYTAAAMKGLIDLAESAHVHLLGMLTWAFEFEGKPYFDGYRTLATNGVDKPVLNFFRMAGLMQGDRVAATSSGAVALEEMQQKGVRQSADTDVLATRAPGETAVMVWHYHDDDVPGPEAPVTVTIRGLPASAHRALLQQYRIDEHHSNAYTVWKEMDSPQAPTAEQYARLQAAGQLQLFDSPRWITAEDRTIQVQLQLPRAALALLRLSYAER